MATSEHLSCLFFLFASIFINTIWLNLSFNERNRLRKRISYRKGFWKGVDEVVGGHQRGGVLLCLRRGGESHGRIPVPLAFFDFRKTPGRAQPTEIPRLAVGIVIPAKTAGVEPGPPENNSIG